MIKDGAIAPLIERLTGHVEAMTCLTGPTKAVPRRGAEIAATIAALRLAATPVDDEPAFNAKVSALSGYVAGLDAARGALTAALIDAALAAEAEMRLAAGLPPPGRRLRGWVAYSSGGPAAIPREAQSPSALPAPALRAYVEVSMADNVDCVLMSFLLIVRQLRAAVAHGEPRGPLIDAFEEHAYALCAWPPPPGAIDDARRTLLHGWLVLRQRRPLAAAILRARVRWPRLASAGPTPR